MRVSETYAQRFAAQLGHNEAKSGAATSGEWERCYRLLAIGALNEIPRPRLPNDVAVLGIMVLAAELVPWALFVSCGNQRTKAFAGDGVDDLLQWLDRCYELFIHVANVSGDLPMGRSGAELAKTYRHGAGEVRYLTGQLREALEQMERDVISDAEDGDERERLVTDDNGNPLRPLFVPGDNFAHIAAYLNGLITEWLSPAEGERFMKRISTGNRELVHSRALSNADEDLVSSC